MEHTRITGNAYQKAAMRTNDGKSTVRLLEWLSSEKTAGFDPGGLVMALMGLPGEVGELEDMFKKWIFHETDVDEAHLKKEAGDVLWYLVMLCQSMGWKLEDVMWLNVDKLLARYPDGFDPDLSQNRKEGDV